MSRLRQLSKDSIIYGIGGIVVKSISFFMLPVFTRIFSPADYGTIEMLSVMSSFLAAILVMGMDSAQSMYFFKLKKEGKKSQVLLVSSILHWRLIWGSVIVAVATLLAPLLNAAFFNGKLDWEYFAVAFAGTLFGQVISQGAEVMRLLHRPWGYIYITFLQSLLSTVLILIAVLLFEQGILGFFLGASISAIVIALICWYQIREYLSFERLHTSWWPKLLRFGAPLVPAGLAMYFMASADRWFVQHYHGEEALGIFAVGAKFALLITLAIETFRKAWWPIAMDSMHSYDGPRTFRLIARLYFGLGISAIVLLTLISPWLIQWFTAPAFHSAWPLVGILAWQSLFYGFFLIVSVGIWKAEKTYLNLYLMTGAAVAGLLLNWLLVPSWSGMGAALATSITYFGWVLASIIVSERLWQVGFPIKLFAVQLTIGVILVCWFVLTDPSEELLLKSIIGFVASLGISLSSLPEKIIFILKQKITKVWT